MAATKRKTRSRRSSGAHGERIARVEERVTAIEDRFSGIEDNVKEIAAGFGDMREAVARIETKLDQSTPGTVKAMEAVPTVAGEGDIVIPKSTISTIGRLFHTHKWGALVAAAVGFFTTYVLPHLLPAAVPGMPVLPPHQ